MIIFLLQAMLSAEKGTFSLNFYQVKESLTLQITPSSTTPKLTAAQK